jgi:hypothetical protein
LTITVEEFKDLLKVIEEHTKEAYQQGLTDAKQTIPAPQKPDRDAGFESGVAPKQDK